MLKIRIHIPNFHAKKICLHTASEVLKLDHLWLIYPGQYAYPIAAFVTPIAEQLATARVFKATWKAPGPWAE